MKTKSIKLDYHLIMCIYYSSDNQLTSSDYRNLWVSTGELYGELSMLGDFWTPSRPPEGKPIKLKLGHTERFDLKCDKERIIYGGGTVSNNSYYHNWALGADLYYSFGDPSITYGIPSYANHVYSVSNLLLSDVSLDKATQHIVDHFRIADKYAPPYGFIDITTPEDGLGGLVFESFSIGITSKERWIDNIKWAYAPTCGKPIIRNIYWGNYFSNKTLEALGGREYFVSELIAQQNGCGRIWEFSNGVLFTLSNMPNDMQPGSEISGNIVQLVHWLLIECGTKQLLSPW